MPVVAENFFFFKWRHYRGGFSTGPTETIEHNVLPGEFSVHTGLSRVQATVIGPLGAAVGIMSFGNTNFGPNPVDWAPLASGKRIGSWTIAMQVAKGEMTCWEVFQTWKP